VSPVNVMFFAVLESRCWEIAYDALGGVGDPSLGEWQERGEIAVHVRRRLTDRERHDTWSCDTSGRMVPLDVVDVRGTREHERRALAMRPFLPAALRGLAIADLT